MKSSSQYSDRERTQSHVVHSQERRVTKTRYLFVLQGNMIVPLKVHLQTLDHK